MVHKSELKAFATPRLPELDGLRGMAILLVLVFHYGVIFLVVEPGSVTSYIYRYLRLTWSGVDLFFVLSGFLIGGILLDNKEATNYFTVFYVRRFCRIFPLYFLWVLLFIILFLAAPMLTSAPPLTWLFDRPLPLWSYATLTQNVFMAQSGEFGSGWLGVTWSLAVEEQFYLTLPFIIRFVPLRKLPWILLCLIALAPMLRIIMFYFHPHGSFPAAYVLMPCRMDALLLGVMCAYMMRQQQIIQHLTDHTKFLYGIFFILLIGTALLTLKSPDTSSFVMTAYGYSWLALLYTCFLLIAVTEKQGVITSITKHPLLRYLSSISYGIYIFHMPMIGLFHGFILQQSPKIQTIFDVIVTIGALLFTLMAAYISYNFFEQRIVAMGHSVKYRRAASSEKIANKLSERMSKKLSAVTRR